MVQAGRLDEWPATRREDGVLLHLPLLGDADLPDELFVLRTEQLPLDPPRAAPATRMAPAQSSLAISHLADRPPGRRPVHHGSVVFGATTARPVGSQPPQEDTGDHLPCLLGQAPS